jgi:superfamily II DNA or RNA helicase
MYQVCLKKIGLKMQYAGAFRRLIMMSGRSTAAREAVLSRNKAMDIALNSRTKLEELKKILANNQGLKTIIFTQHNKLVYDISNRFLIPFITHKSSKQERQDALSGFKEGRYNAIVTSKVLDEGVDVPDAELGIIVSGTGSSREFIQRLGRLLRPKPEINRKAKLIEIISSGTREMETSAKRKRALNNMDRNKVELTSKK